MPVDVPLDPNFFRGYKTPADVFPSVPPPTSIGNILRGLFETAGGTRQQASDVTNSIRGLLGYGPKAEGPSSISSTKPGLPKSQTATSLAKSGAVVAATTSGALVLLNPGLQTTVKDISTANAGALQSAADAFKDIAKAGETFTQFITNNPLILVGILAIVGIMVVKK